METPSAELCSCQRDKHVVVLVLCVCVQRDAVVRGFRSGCVWVLICTDVMCRGMDFKGVNLVVNYDFPNSDYVYIHRIGDLAFISVPTYTAC